MPEGVATEFPRKSKQGSPVVSSQIPMATPLPSSRGNGGGASPDAEATLTGQVPSHAPFVPVSKQTITRGSLGIGRNSLLPDHPIGGEYELLGNVAPSRSSA